MDNSSFSEVEVIKFSPKIDNQSIFDPEEEEKINTSNSYSVPTSEMYYNSEDDNSEQDIVETKKVLKVANPDIKNSNSQKSNKTDSIKNKILTDSINVSLQNNINDNSINLSPVSKVSKILPKSITSDKRKSLDIKKSDIDTSSIVVEINGDDEEIIEIDTDKVNDSFVVMDQPIDGINGIEDLKKKKEMMENRISLTTAGDFTYVDNDQNQTPRNDADISMPEKSDIVNTNLKRLTDTTSVPPIIDDNIKEDTNEIDKAAADISNKDHKITIEDEDEDNTCAICLIETQKPTDIENFNKESNETVVAPSKEDIDNFECKLHCMHKFHYSCIAQWLERSQNCPICRVAIKHYEIEAIEKRFDISIKVKEDPLPLVVPHYNETFDFDTVLSVDLVKDYMSRHLPWVNFNTYFKTKFYFYSIGFILLTLFGIILSIISLLKNHEKLFFITYTIIITIIIGFIVFLIQYLISVKKNKKLLFMIAQPASSSFFYGFVTVIFFMVLISLHSFGSTENPFTVEKIYVYCLAAFFSIVIIWSYVEVYFCFDMYKEDNRRRVDADVSRRNQEIIERNRVEDAEEREEFERTFGHLND